LSFDSRVVVVTGGTGGLGRAVVQRFLDEGAQVHLPCFEPAGHPALTSAPWAADPRVTFYPGLSLSDEATVAAFYAGLPSLYASVHLAGGFRWAKLSDTDLAAFRQQWEMNAVTAFLCTREALRRLVGDAVPGRIVNVSAKTAAGGEGIAAYSASKAAVASVTLSAAEEAKDHGIWVNAIVPSIIDTPVNRASMPDADHSKWPSPDDLAPTITFLASPENRATRGALVPVYGSSA
jgi:NAD(P)-dependent dehydrogenase (short-subunit alcohol dehydrogenase family)